MYLFSDTMKAEFAGQARTVFEVRALFFFCPCKGVYDARKMRYLRALLALGQTLCTLGEAAQAQVAPGRDAPDNAGPGREARIYRGDRDLFRPQIHATIF